MKTGAWMLRRMKAERWTALLAGMARRGMAALLIYTMIPLSMGDVYAYAQEAPPPPPDQGYDAGPPPQAYQPLSPEQLDQLVAPIALYPDSLVALVLAAATYPSQVVDADRWVNANAGAPPEQLAEMANGMPWDPSVKSLTAFPNVLDNMNRNLDWTTQLGNAYYNQPQDVMNAVQYMRQVAYQRGELRSTPQLYVTYAPGYIAIAPANPEVVYVPYYDPWTVYGTVIVGHPWYRYYYAPPRGVVFGAFGLGFGVGIAVGVFAHWGWGCNHWHPDWQNRTIVYNRTTYISRSVTVINHGYYGRFDRSPQAREFNRSVAMHAAVYNRMQPSQNWNRGNQSLARPQPQQYRGVQNWNRNQPQNFNRTPQNWNRGNQNFARPQPQQYRGVQNWNRNQPQNFNRAPQNWNRGAQQNYARPQVQNHGAQNWNRGNQNNRQPARRPQPENHRPPAHSQDHGGGHGRWR